MATTTEEEKKRAQGFGFSPRQPGDSSTSNQIPTGATRTVPPDGSQDNPLNNDVGRNLVNTASALPGAAAVPGVAGAVASGFSKVAEMAPAASAVGKAVQAVGPYAVPAAGAAGLGFASAGNSSNAPSTSAPAPALPSPVPQAANPGAAPSQGKPVAGGDVALGFPGSPVTAPQLQNNITRTNDPATGIPSYSGSNIGPNATINGKEAGGGFMTTGVGFQPNQAAQASQPTTPGPGLGFMPQADVRNSSNDWQARNNLRNLEVSASSTSGSKRDIAMRQDAYAKALGADIALTGGADPATLAAMRGQTDIAQTGMREAGATARANAQEAGLGFRAGQSNQIAQGELALKQTAAGFQSRSAQRLEQLQMAYQAAKPEDRAAIADQIRVLSGQAKPEQFKVAAGGQQLGPNGEIYKTPDRVFNANSGQFVDQTSPTAQAPQSRPVGTISEVNGKRASWDGKQWNPI